MYMSVMIVIFREHDRTKYLYVNKLEKESVN